MNILVTGGAGYKGVVLTEHLLAAGHDVTIFDNFLYGYGSIMHLATHPKLTVVKQDIRNGVENLKQYEAVFHLAGVSGLAACAANPYSARTINVEATKALVDGLSPDQALIFASTTSLYGKAGIACDETTPITPISEYATTKLEAETYILEHHPDAVSLRFATIFGHSPKPRLDLMANDFTYKACTEKIVVLFDSYAQRSMMHVQDAARAYVFTLDNIDKMRGRIFNAGGNDMNFSKREIADKIKEYVDYTIIDAAVPGKDLRHFIVTYDKIAALGFRPEIDMDTGIQEMTRIFQYYEPFSHFRTI